MLSWFVVLLCCGLQLALLFGVFQVEALAIRDKSVSPVLAIAWVACGLSAAAAIDSRLFKHVQQTAASQARDLRRPGAPAEDSTGCDELETWEADGVRLGLARRDGRAEAVAAAVNW